MDSAHLMDGIVWGMQYASDEPAAVPLMIDVPHRGHGGLLVNTSRLPLSYMATLLSVNGEYNLVMNIVLCPIFHNDITQQHGESCLQ